MFQGLIFVAYAIHEDLALNIYTFHNDPLPYKYLQQSRPSSRGPVYRGNGFSLRDGYDSDSGIGYSRNRAPSPSPSMNGSESGGFVFDKNVSPETT